MASLFLSFNINSLINNVSFINRVRSRERINHGDYGFKSSNGINTGILYDISNRIMLEIGVNQPAKILAIKRISESMNTKKRTCTLVGDTPDATKNWDLIEPIGYQFTIGILPKKDILVTDYASLKGVVLAIPFGVSFDHNFDVDKGLSKVTTRNYTNAMKMVKLMLS